MPTFTQYMFSYLLAAVLFFQGLHLFQETKAPLGAVPDEVKQETPASQKWGAALITWSVLLAGVALLSYTYPGFASAVVPLRNTGMVIGAAFGIWVVFMGRTVEYMGTPSADDHGHASDHGHA